MLNGQDIVVADELAPASDRPPVWPDPHARQRGIAVTPLHPAVPELVRRDPSSLNASP